MKQYYKRNTIVSVLCLLMVFTSCRSIPVEDPDTSVETATDTLAAEESFSALMGAVENALISQNVNRDIDDRDWLMSEINTRADADQLMISMVFDALYFRNWDDDAKKSFLSSVIGNRIHEDPEGALNALRRDNLSELDYLLNQSLLLKESPWMVRDFFDERTEFSYWYLLYIGRSFDMQWQKQTVLPVMRSLIREDRITPVSYIWLNKPESLGSMESEIRSAGYPWNRLLHLLAMSRYIRAEVNRLYPQNSQDPRPEGMLF